MSYEKAPSNFVCSNNLEFSSITEFDRMWIHAASTFCLLRCSKFAKCLFNSQWLKSILVDMPILFLLGLMLATNCFWLWPYWLQQILVPKNIVLAPFNKIIYYFISFYLCVFPIAKYSGISFWHPSQHISIPVLFAALEWYLHHLTAFRFGFLGIVLIPSTLIINLTSSFGISSQSLFKIWSPSENCVLWPTNSLLSM